ncbi:PEP-CTERM sorting domain-containing protein [Komarekiella delphini-convector]|nr:PEP-CTERM sorting domain-containing protein [Komarekiella delphini-convector]
MLNLGSFLLTQILKVLTGSTLIYLMLATAHQEAKAAELFLDGELLPSEQGWNSVTDFGLPPDVSTDGKVLTVNTIGISSPPGVPSGQFTLFYRDVGMEKMTRYSINFIEFSLKVIAVSEKHNTYDAGIAFLPSYNDLGFGSVIDRSQMIYFDEDSIGWGDETDSFALDTTKEFRTYRLTVENNGQAKIFVDNMLALQRSNFQTNGIIAFGDQTNDSGLDGRFALKSISVERTPVVPEPFTLGGTAVAGAIGLWMKRKHKASKVA